MMAQQFENCNVNNITFSENTFTLKEECEDDDFVDDKVLVSETDIRVNTDLKFHVRYNIIKENEMFTTLNNIKTELLSEVQNNIDDNPEINDNVKKEEGIDVDDIKIKFDNDLLFCHCCRIYCQDYCTKCGMLVHILNQNTMNNTENRTQEELPNDILEIRDSFGQLGIFALRVIPRDVKFGPFTGLSASESDWKLKGGKFIVGEDKSKYLNWLQYVNPARCNSEGNLLVFQCEGRLYYKSIREIHKGEELLVLFGEGYEDSLNRNIEMDFIPITEQYIKVVFACTFCCLGFSSRTYLVNHKAICLNNKDGKFSIEELTQCPFCNIYMDKKEYSENHVIYCCERNIRKCIPPVSNIQTAEVKRDRKRGLQIYKCTQCNYKTKVKGDLQNHSNQHYKVKMYKCEICPKQFRTKTYLKMHMENVHIDVDKTQHREYLGGDTIGYKKKKANLEVPKKTKHLKELKCDYKSCVYKTNTKECLKRHIKTVHIRQFDYKCEMCEYKTNMKPNLERHMKAKHLKEFDYKCGMCEYKTYTKSFLKKHIKTKHLKEFDYNCVFCGYKCTRNSYLQIHLKSKHLKEFDYKCEICEYKTNSKMCLEEHIKTKHLKVFDYKCEKCEYKTNYKPCLKIHKDTIHIKEFNYKCEMCEHKTNTRSDLSKHIKTRHLKEFAYGCEMCEYKTNRKLNLQIHLKSKHLKEFDYKCEMCEYKTNWKSYLETHVKSVHIRVLNYRCEMCAYRTSLKAELSRHVKTRHLKEYYYNCEVCEYTTNRKSDLQIHLKTKHLKEFNYKCEMCEYKTNRKSSFQQHTKTIHLKEFDYKCDMCEYKTNRKSHLERHVKREREINLQCDQE